ncbi:MAG: hypothetical protein K6D94_11085 [Clostridiales bacterium]|nr:hypothetical protein [Clostridiales bacterium]
MRKKMLSLLLAALMLSAAAACGESAENKPAASTTAAQDVDVDDAETESEFSEYASTYLKFDDPQVPDETYGGRKFVIIRPGSKEPPQEETGDVVDDAVYKSQRAVEERLEIDIDYVMVPSIVDIQPALKKAVMAGDSSYDVAVNHSIESIPNLLKDRLVHDWNHVPNVNFSQPYWNQSLNSTLSVKGILPIACGNYFISSPMCIFFNKQIQKDYGVEDLYGAVNEGVWTLDRFVSDSKLVSADLNGDGVYGVEDLYGFVGMSDYQFMGFLAGCDQFVVEKDEEDFPTVAVDNEKTFNIFTKLHDLIYGTTCAKVWAYGTDESTHVKFTDNHALFEIEGGLGTAQTYRSMETDFGIIPCPKYDEGQADYMSFELGSFLMVPVTVSDIGLSGTVCELLNAENRRNMLPVYVDKMLVSKAARDNESESMIYLILDSIVYDFGVNLGQYNALSYVLGFSLREDTSDFASYVSKQLKSANKHYSKVYEYYLGYEDMYG